MKPKIGDIAKVIDYVFGCPVGALVRIVSVGEEELHPNTYNVKAIWVADTISITPEKKKTLVLNYTAGDNIKLLDAFQTALLPKEIQWNLIHS